MAYRFGFSWELLAWNVVFGRIPHAFVDFSLAMAKQPGQSSNFFWRAHVSVTSI